MTKIYAALAAAAVAGLLGGTAFSVWNSRANDPFADCRGGAVGGGEIGGPFTLMDKTGATVTDKDIITQPTLVYFGYTFCPDVCPLDNARNAEAVDILEESGIEVTPLFITIDPARDTPQVVGEFAANLHPRMIGLTGTDAQVKAASQAYKTYFKKQDSGDEFYLMDHSTFTYLVLPGKGFVEFYKRDDTAETIASSAACYISKS
jgi:protein SCO1